MLDAWPATVIIQRLNFTMETNTFDQRELAILDVIEQNPDVTQATLAQRLGVAVGTVNWHIKRLVAKGYVKIQRAERRKLRYLITPEGMALRARLTFDYIEQQFSLYRRVRRTVTGHIAQAREAGYTAIRLVGEGDVADICRLTCLEQNMPLTEDIHAPALVVDGLRVRLEMEATIDE